MPETLIETPERAVRLDPSRSAAPEVTRRRSPRVWLIVALVLLAGLAWLRFGASDATIAGLPGVLQKPLASTRTMLGAAPAAPDKPAAGSGQRAVPVAVASVQTRTMPVEFRSVGTVEAQATVAIRSRVDGVVERVLVADGATVKAGEPLIELDMRPIQADVDAQQAAIQRDQAQLANARLVLGRANDLAARGAAAKQSLDDAKTNVESLEAELAGDEARLRSLQLQLSFHTITAPFDGRIGIVGVRQGAFVRSADNGGAIVTINQVDPVYVAMGVPQGLLSDLADAKRAGTARIEVTLPGTSRTLSGPVTMVDNSVGQGTGLVTARAVVANGEATLWPGTLTDARLILREQADALVVPIDAVQNSQTGPYLFTVDEHDVAHVVPIRLARTQDDLAVLASGPPAGTRVVVDGQIRLTDGVKVKAVSTADDAHVAATAGTALIQ